MAAVRDSGLETTIEIDLDACELECLIDMLLHSKDTVIRLLGKRMPRPVPPKRRKSVQAIREAVIERWAYSDVRAYLQDFMFNSSRTMRAGVHQRKTLRAFLREGVQPGTIIYFAHLEGLDPHRMLASMSVAVRQRFVERQAMLENLIRALYRQRDGKVQDGRRSIDAAIAKAAERRTRALRERLETVSRKHERAQSVVADVATEFKRQIQELEG